MVACRVVIPGMLLPSIASSYVVYFQSDWASALMPRCSRTDGELIRTYQFWAKPIGELPPEVWQIARDSQRLWNQLVQLREDVAFNCETLPEHAGDIRARFWNLLIGKEGDCRRWRLNIKHASGLPWAIRDAILDRFVITCSRAAARKANWPRVHDRIGRINIFHRFADGAGRPIDRLFIAKGRHGWRFGIEPVPASAYIDKSRVHTNNRLSHGFFGLSKTTRITFKMVLHRPLPSDAVVKRVDWRGFYHPIHG